MAIEINDPYGGGQPDIPLGKSSLPVRETYSADPHGMRMQYEDKMQNAHQLFNAVKQLSETFHQNANQQQEVTDKVAMLQKDAVDTGGGLATQGGGGGILSRAFPGAGSPDGSAASAASAPVRATLQHYAGEKAATVFFDKDPEFQALQANKDLMNNPAELDKQLTELWAKKSQELQVPGDPHGLFTGGMASGFEAYRRRLLGQSSADSIQYQRGVATEGFKNYIQNHQSDLTPTQQSAYKAATDAGVDPNKLFKLAAIENPQWNNHSVSSNGSTGITQISDGRWDDIKKQIAKDDPDLAARLTDRTDPYQNARAWAAELPRMEEKARAVLGRDPKDEETYLYWFQPATADRALKNPGAAIGSIYSAATIAANPAVFKGTTTISDVLAKVGHTMNSGSGMHVQYQPSDRLPRQLVTQDTWQDNFTQNGYKWSDFRNSGEYGGPGQIDRRTIDALDQLTTFRGKGKIGINSAYRSEAYNYKVTGTNTANHPSGDALDLAITDPQDQLRSAKFLASIGARGIELTKGHLHFDFATARPNQEEPVRVFTSRDNPVSPDLLGQAKQAVQEGLADKQSGNYHPMTGFQGKPVDPTEALIQVGRTKYGIPPAEGRKMVMKSAADAAINKAYSGDAAGAHQDISNLRQNFDSMSAEEEKALNMTHQEINQIQQSLRTREKQKDADDALDASNNFVKSAEDHSTKNPNAPPLLPKQSDYPKTVDGYNAFKHDSALALNIRAVPEATSQGNLINATSEIQGDPSAFAKKYGFDDWQKVTPNQLRDAIYKQTPGQYTPEHVAQLMAEYEKNRQALPVSVAVAKQQAEINKVEIEQSFLRRTDVMKAVTDANSKMTAEGLMPNDPLTAKAEMAKYVGMASHFFQENYAVRAKAAMLDNNGQPLSGEQKQALAEQALQSTQLYSESLANAIVANKANLSATTQAAFNMQHPQEQFESQVFAAQKADLGKQGLVATNVHYPGVPKGAFVLLGKDGKPQQTENGSYKMYVGNQIVFFNPSYNVVPQGAPQPTEAPAELRPAAEPEAPAPAAPQPATNQPPYSVEGDAAAKTRWEQTPTWAKHLINILAQTGHAGTGPDAERMNELVRNFMKGAPLGNSDPNASMPQP